MQMTKGMKHVVLAAMLCSACGAASPVAPDPTINGTWAGSVTSTQVVATGSVRATLSQLGLSQIQGTWSTTYADGRFNNSGFLSGTLIGANVTLDLSPSTPPTGCPIHVTAVLSGGQLLTGNYTVVNCTVPDRGLFTARRQ